MKKIKILTLFLISITAISSCKRISYKINPTGQTLCYDVDGKVIETPKVGDKYFGQDANHLSGVQFTFVDNGDGTVTDNNSGLMWQQTPPIEGMTWAQAKEYCENLEFGGYSDWRLPTLKELFSISNFSEGWPYLDTTYFKLASGHITKDEQFWADNKYVGETVEGRDDAAFGVNHVTGHIKAYPAGSNMGNRGGRTDNGNENSQQRPQIGERNERDSTSQRPPMGQQRADNGQNQQQRPPMGQQRADNGQNQQQRPPMGQQRADSSQNQQQRPPMGQQRAENGQNQQQRPPMGQQRADSSQNQQQQRPPMGQQGGNNMANNRPMGNPMAKQVRAVRGAIYGENKFVDNGDGTITDKATGLMWSKADNGKGIEWIDALTYAENATLANHDDWRLPNVKELQSIVDYTRAPSSKGVEAAIDPIFSCTPYINEAKDDDFGYYWSSTSACFTKGRPFYFAWYVAFGKAVNNKGADFHGAGAVRFDSKSDNDMVVEGGEERYYNFVRLVRNVSK